MVRSANGKPKARRGSGTVLKPRPQVVGKPHHELVAWQKAAAAAGSGGGRADRGKGAASKGGGGSGSEDAHNYRQHTLADFWSELIANASWASRSLLLFHTSSRIRKLAISLTHTAEWRAIVQLLIAANCVNMMLYDPLESERTFNKLLEENELRFTIAFTVELVVKVVACGLFIPGPRMGQPVPVYFRGRRDLVPLLSSLLTRRPQPHWEVVLEPPYLTVGWHRLDALIVVSSWAAILLDSSSVTVLRLLRLLKPLRTLKALPGLRLLISVCGVSLYAHVAVQLISNGVMAYFAAPVLILLGGSMTGRCVDASEPDQAAAAHALALANANATFERLCGLTGGGRACGEGRVCADSGIK